MGLGADIALLLLSSARNPAYGRACEQVVSVLIEFLFASRAGTTADLRKGDFQFVDRTITVWPRTLKSTSTERTREPCPRMCRFPPSAPVEQDPAPFLRRFVEGLKGGPDAFLFSRAAVNGNSAFEVLPRDLTLALACAGAPPPPVGAVYLSHSPRRGLLSCAAHCDEREQTVLVPHAKSSSSRRARSAPPVVMPLRSR
jgi:hypothetical protein